MLELSNTSHKKIALVHDWLLSLGGAERTLKVLHEMFPEAPVYTFFYNKKFTDDFLPNAQIRSSFIQNLYKLRIFNHKLFLPFLPIAAESFDLSEYDLVISSSIAFSKGLILKPKTKHICYCYSPTRFLWDWHNEYNQQNQNNGWPVKVVQHFLRIWDRQAANRVDQFVAISKNIQRRIKKYYGRESIVIYPPAQRFDPGSSKKSNLEIRPDYFLIVSRLFPHKNIDIAIKAFNKLDLPLVVIGSGPEYGRLKKMIEDKSMIKLLEEVPDEELAGYYANAKALIMPQEEDFGLTPLEAMSFGKPTLALHRGGALEYVLENINGEFFDDPHPAVLADGVRRLNESYQNYSPLVIKKTAERFSRSRFEEEIRNLITRF